MDYCDKFMQSPLHINFIMINFLNSKFCFKNKIFPVFPYQVIHSVKPIKFLINLHHYLKDIV